MGAIEGSGEVPIGVTALLAISEEGISEAVGAVDDSPEVSMVTVLLFVSERGRFESVDDSREVSMVTVLLSGSEGGRSESVGMEGVEGVRRSFKDP